jgi:hypothetical protein
MVREFTSPPPYKESLMAISNRAVAKDFVQRDGNHFLVSTVKLPLSEGIFHEDWPYETMVFPADANGNVTDWVELACHRYMSMNEAVEGHAHMVAHYSETF